MTLYDLPFENVTCRMENVYVYIRWFEKECFFLIDSVILYLLLPQAIKIQLIWIQIIYFQIIWIQLNSDNLFRRKYFFFKFFFDAKGPLNRVCDCFSFIPCYLQYDNTAFFHWHILPSVEWKHVFSLHLSSAVSRWKIEVVYFFVKYLFHLFQGSTAGQVAGMTMNDEIWGNRICGFIRWEI